ncbi:hypothetical protein [Xanthomonas phaseoli]|uniref:hypothetical protein n=1 Tax=Xanthomonas phaseoli TaxID=1985254 RepID=UPI001EE64045|nr:hypothetical protein [Xanthomonas phaseoli]
MKIPDTKPSGMPEEDSAPGLWGALTEKFPWLQDHAPHAFMFGVVALGFLLVIVGAITDRSGLIVASQYLFLLTGALQILAAVYLSNKQAAHLRGIREQEKQKPTEFVRSVQLTRAKIDLLDQVWRDSPSDISLLAANIANARKKYLALEAQQSSPGSRYLVLTQADLARSLLTASSNTACGTLLVVAGTLISIFS